MSKQAIQELLEHYGVLFSETLAEKLFEIITQERENAIKEHMKEI